MNRIIKFVCLLSFAALLAGVLAACQPQPGAPAGTPPPKATAAVPAKATWQEDWDRTVAAAKNEGKVSVITRWPPNVRETVAAALRQKFGLEIDYTAGILGEHWPKIEAERRAGMYLRDVAMDGVTALIATVVAGGAAETMERVFILPEVKDGAVWRDKRLPFYDKDGKMFMYISRIGPTLAINKDDVRIDEFKSWRSLLEPKWKGKILVYDPTIPGPGNALMTTVGEIMGTNYLRELAKQEPVFNRDMRTQVEWIARSKYAVALGFEFTLFEQMRGQGAPLVHVVPAEGTYFGSAFGSMVVFERPGNPNATRVFTNWLLSKEGQTLFARAAKEQSRRADVPPELVPDRLFQEGMKYVDFDTEDSIKKRTEMFRLSKEIFGLK